MKRSTRQPNATLVLGGGGIGGAFCISALQKVPDIGQFVHIAGTSIGALIGAMLVQGMSPADVARRLLDTPPPLGDGADSFFGAMNRGLGSIAGVPIGVFQALHEAHSLRRFVTACLPQPDALCSTYLDRFICTVYDADAGGVIDTVDLVAELPRLTVALAVTASCLVPGIFSNNGRLLDGGLGANVPVQQAWLRWPKDRHCCVIANGGKYETRGLTGPWDASKAVYLYPTMQSCQTFGAFRLARGLYDGEVLAFKGNFNAGFLDDEAGKGDAIHAGVSWRDDVNAWFTAVMEESRRGE